MKSINTQAAALENDCLEALKRATSITHMEAVRLEFFSRKGKIAELMGQLKDLSLEEKRVHGPHLNALKESLEKSFQTQFKALQQQAYAAVEEHERFFDVTASLPEPTYGSLHPHTLLTERIQTIFTAMGFQVADGPEVDSGHYNFEALNIPKDHPARDMFDTFWLDVPGMLLRTHTSSVQARALEAGTPPLAVIVPGRTFRYEATDASHDCMFRQVEGVFVDKNVSMAELLGTLQTFLRQLFEKEDLTIRVRPGYFPFVEPGIEIDISCPFCATGCSTCKHSNWIEMLGAGLIHPNVLKAANIDPTVYSGFAFGAGLTRLAMLYFGIKDIRLLHTPALEFLKQF